jgi:predicted  nucleic acid-binding Zn-ribbon protein
MAEFRVKKSRDHKKDLIGGTLDSVHQTFVNSIENNEITQQNLDKARKEFDVMDSKNLLELAKKYNDIEFLKTKVNSNETIQNYFSKNADIFLKYYGSTETSNNQTSVNDTNTFMKYIVQQKNEGPSRKQIFTEYLSRMKLTDGTEKIDSDVSSEHCTKCNIAREEISSEGILVCPECGSEEYMMVVSDFAGFKDPPKERNNYAYKKINHLNEILNQFQAKESTIIPDEVMNEVVCEIKKRRIQNIASLSEKDIREILKKLNRSKYYEHATHIVSRLNGNPPPTITPEIEEKIRAMFQEIQAPFLLYCPNDRTNFLSYSYILYKFFELLELDEYKIYFPLLKSRDRLISHDEIWEKICEYLRWEFIRSV